MESIMIKNDWLKNKLCFHLLIDTIHEEDREKLQRFAEKWKVSINLYFMNNRSMDSFTRFSLTTRNGKILYSYYYRWLIPYVVDPEIEKVLYLDTDTVCNNDVGPVLQEKFNEAIVAINDNYLFREFNAKRMNLSAKDYFCGGLTYLNIKKMKLDRTIEKILQYLHECVENHVDLPLTEQDAANLVLQGNVKIADDSYHYPVLLERKDMHSRKVQEAAKNAYFVHFMGRAKPWKIEAQDFSLVKVWTEAKLRSEWKDAELVGEWNRLAYRTAAIAAWSNGDYLKWTRCKIGSFICRVNKAVREKG